MLTDLGIGKTEAHRCERLAQLAAEVPKGDTLPTTPTRRLPCLR